MKDHLFNLLNLIVKYNSMVQTPVRRRFEDLIQWLDKEQPTVNALKVRALSENHSSIRQWFCPISRKFAQLLRDTHGIT